MKINKIGQFLVMSLLVSVIVITSVFAQDHHGEGAEQPTAVNEDEASTATEVVELAKNDDGASLVDFRLLTKTRIKRKPPPIYPSELAEVDGTKVAVRGYMAPYDSLDSMKTFMLMPISGGCFFCEPPSPLAVVLIRQGENAVIEFIGEPIEVTGTISLWKSKSPDKDHRYFIYVMDADKVEVVDSIKFPSSGK